MRRCLILIVLFPALCAAQPYIGNKYTRASFIRSWEDVGSYPVTFMDTTRMTKPILMDSTAQLTSVPFFANGAKVAFVYRGTLGYFMVTPTQTVRLDSTWSADSSYFATRYWVLSQGYLTAVDSATKFASRYWVVQNFQPLDGDLTAIAALTGTNTIYYRSASNTWTAVTIGSNLTFSGGTLSASDSARIAYKAMRDGSGNVITSTYLTAVDSATAFLSIGDAAAAYLIAGRRPTFSVTGNATTNDSLRLTAGSGVTLTPSGNVVTIAASGSTSPGGSTTQVQFNDAGSFGGDADWTWNKTTNKMGVVGDIGFGVGDYYITAGLSSESTNPTLSFSAYSASTRTDLIKAQSSLSTATLNFPQTTASTLFGGDASKNLQSVTAGDGIQSGAATITASPDFDGGLETVDDSLNIKLYGTTLTKSSSGLSVDTSVVTGTVYGLSLKQPLDADLTTIAGLTATTNNFIVSTSSAWSSRTPTQARTSLGLATGDTPTFNGLTLTSDISMSGHLINVDQVNLKGAGLSVLGFDVDGQYAYGTNTVGNSYGFAAYDDALMDKIVVMKIVNSSSAASDEYINAIKPLEFTTLRTASASAADAGVIRLANAETIAWEASPAGTDVTLTTNTSEVLTSSAPVSATTGFQIGGAAALGNNLRGNGTNFISSKSDTSTYLTANATTTSTSLVRTPGLTVYMAANEIWHFEADLKVGSSSAAGTKYGIDIPTSATMYVNITGTTSAAGTETEEQVTADATAATTAFNTAGLTTAAVGAFVHIEGVIINGANAGNFEVMHLKVTSGTSTIYAGSRLTAWRTN